MKSPRSSSWLLALVLLSGCASQPPVCPPPPPLQIDPEIRVILDTLPEPGYFQTEGDRIIERGQIFDPASTPYGSGPIGLPLPVAPSTDKPPAEIDGAPVVEPDLRRGPGPWEGLNPRPKQVCETCTGTSRKSA